MKALLRSILTVAVIAGMANTASAGLVPGVIPGGTATNEFAGLLAGTSATDPIGGWYGAQIYLNGDSDILVEWYGGEAGYLNEFWWEDDLFFKHNSTINPSNPSATAIASFVLSDVASGLLPFSFVVPNGPTVANGGNPDNSLVDPNYFVSFDLTQTTDGGPLGGSFVWIFFDDGGPSSDDNHDDMAIKLSIADSTVAAVPEPGSMLLLGSGLAALAARRRRRS